MESKRKIKVQSNIIDAIFSGLFECNYQVFVAKFVFPGNNRLFQLSSWQIKQELSCDLFHPV